MAYSKNYVIDQGSDWYDVIYVTNDDGTPYDLTEFQAAMVMKRSYQSKISYPFVATITDAIKGEITISLDADVSVGIRPSRYVYDVVVAHQLNNLRFRVVEGVITLTPTVTLTI